MTLLQKELDKFNRCYDINDNYVPDPQFERYVPSDIPILGVALDTQQNTTCPQNVTNIFNTTPPPIIINNVNTVNQNNKKNDDSDDKKNKEKKDNTIRNQYIGIALFAISSFSLVFISTTDDYIRLSLSNIKEMMNQYIYSQDGYHQQIATTYNSWMQLYTKRSKRSFFLKSILGVSSILASYGIYKSNHHLIQIGLIGKILSLSSLLWVYLKTDKDEEKEWFLKLKSLARTVQ